MPPAPAPLVIPAELLTGFSRSMEATQADAKSAREASEETREAVKDGSAATTKAVEDLRAEIRPMLDEYAALIKARRDAGIKVDAERLEAVSGVRSVLTSVLGSATLRYLLGMVGTGIAAWFAARYDLPDPPQDAAPHSQEAAP